MLSRLFSNYLKIIKIKDRYVGFHIENLQSAKNQTGSDIFSPQNSSYIIIIFMLSRLFSNFKNHKNQRSQIMLNFILKIYNLFNIKPDRYFFTSK